MIIKVAMPYGGSCEYRARNAQHVIAWIEEHHDWPISQGFSDRIPFSPAQARNSAAAAAGDYDVLVFWDSDNIVHPAVVRDAVKLAAATDKLVIAGSGHIYMDELSTNRYFETGLMFPEPTDWADTKRQRFVYDPRSVYRDPCSGIFAVTRTLWEQTGGYVDSLSGQDSHEDLIFWQQAIIFGAGVTRVPGMKLHLWHPTANRIRGDNHRHYHHLVKITGRPNARRHAHAYLTQLGHRLPL